MTKSGLHNPVFHIKNNGVRNEEGINKEKITLKKVDGDIPKFCKQVVNFVQRLVLPRPYPT